MRKQITVGMKIGDSNPDPQPHGVWYVTESHIPQAENPPETVYPHPAPQDQVGALYDMIQAIQIHETCKELSSQQERESGLQ